MGKLRNIEQKFSFGLRVFYNLFRLLPLIYSDVWISLTLTAITIAAAVGNEIVNYKTGVIPGKFYVALLQRNEKSFWHLLWISSLCYLGLCLIMAIMSFFSGLLYVEQRKNLVRKLHNLYYHHNFYYQINSIDNEGIDNPDQRITQDADKLTKLIATSIIPTVLLAPFTISYYSVKVWSTAGGWGVGMIFAYFLIGVLINRILIGPLTPWAARVEKAEGDFRYKHVTVRVNAEESAFANASDFEHEYSELSFKSLYERLRVFVLWKFPSQFFQSFFDYYGGCMSYILQLFPIFVFHLYDKMDPTTLSGQISNNAFYFIYLINCFTRLTDLAINIAELGGYVMRISEFIDHAKEHQDGFLNDAFSSVASFENLDKKCEEKSNLLEVEHISFGSPTNPTNLILTDISFKLPRHKNLLITGPSGIGKTSLIRVIAKLWPSHGILTKNFNSSDEYYLPQQPYFPVGKLSLKQQLLFPRIEDEADDNEILKLMNDLKLAHLLHLVGNIHSNVDFEWQETLSPGEQQRLCFARMLLKHPTIVFLDESTCNVDENTETEMYNMLRKNNITYVTVGHRQSLRAYHHHELRIISSTSYLFLEYQKL